MSSAHKPNPHTVEVLRNHGFSASTEEGRFQVFSKAWEDKYKYPRCDFLGIFDVIAMRPDQGIIAIQTTDAKSIDKHRKKMLESEYLRPWLASSGRGQLWQWRKGLKGTREVWRPNIWELQLIDGVIHFVPIDAAMWLGTLHSKNRDSAA
jgi:hypothetical protein